MLIERHMGTRILEKPCSKNTNPIFDMTEAILQVIFIIISEGKRCRLKPGEIVTYKFSNASTII